MLHGAGCRRSEAHVFECARRLHPPPCRHAGVGKATDHQVVQDPDVQQCQRLLQPNRDRPVGCTWLRVAGWVVVEEHQGGRVVMQRALGDDPRVDFAGIDGAGEEVLGGDDPVLRVQEDDAENFVRQSRASGLEVGCGCIGVGEAAFPQEPTLQDARRCQQDALFIHRQLVLSPGVRRALHLLASTGAGCASWGPAGGAVRQGRTRKRARRQPRAVRAETTRRRLVLAAMPSEAKVPLERR